MAMIRMGVPYMWLMRASYRPLDGDKSLVTFVWFDNAKQ